MKKTVLFLLVLSVTIGGSAYASSGFVVIWSTGETLARGKIVSPSQTFSLQAGQSLKLLSSTGQIVELTGPFNGDIESGNLAGDSDLLEPLSSFLKSADDADLALAVFRDLSFADNSVRGDLWGVEVGRPGNFCIRSDLPVVLWWPDAVKGTSVALADTVNSNAARVNWENRNKQNPWPENLPIFEDHVYTSNIDISSHVHEFTVSRVPDELSSDVERVVWLSEHACRKQALRLLGEMVGG